MEISRRGFLELSALALGGAFLSTIPDTRPVLSQKTPQFVDPRLKSMGKELESWTLRNGFKMSSLPDVKKVAELLNGRVDPRQFIPFMGIPLRFRDNPNITPGLFEPTIGSDRTDPRSTKIRLTNGEIVKVEWLRSNQPVVIGLSEEVQKSSGRNVILVKETSHIYDLVDYSRLYLRVLAEDGVEIGIENPTNILTSETEILLNKALAAQDIEDKKDWARGASYWQELVDMGTGLRVGSILFANWYLDQVNSKINVPNTPWVQTGHDYSGFMQHKGYIREQGRSFVWTHGKAPEILSKEFISLFSEYTGRVSR